MKISFFVVFSFIYYYYFFLGGGVGQKGEAGVFQNLKT